MKRVRSLLSVVAAGMLCAVTARSETQPLQLALFNPIQLVDEEASIRGVRLNFGYGANEALTGLDLGLVNQNRGNLTGVELGLVNYNKGDTAGFLLGLGNFNEGDVSELQLGAWNEANELATGSQLGVVNRTYMSKGMQLGLLNVTQRTDAGIQLGLVNYNPESRLFPVMPFINW